MPFCSVEMCKKNSATSSASKDGISFHRFPKIPEIKEKWIKATQKQNWYPKIHDVICSRHFTPDCIDNKEKKRYLSSSAVPTLSLPMLVSINNIPVLNVSNHNTVTCSLQQNVLPIGLPNTSKKSKKKPLPQTQQYDPFQEYANDSSDEESSNVKQEQSEEAENSDDESENDAPDTERVYLKSTYQGKRSEDGQTQSKRARLKLSECQFDYTEQLYEFGKYVAEQLMCLDVEDARIAQEEIKEILSKFNMNKIMHCMVEPSTSNVQPVTGENCASLLTQTTPYVSSELKVNTARPSVTQSKLSNVKPAESSVSKSGSQVDIFGPSGTQSGVVLQPSLTKFAVLNVNPSASSMEPVGYVIVPKEEKELVTQSGPSVGSVTQSGSSQVISVGTLTQSGSSSITFSGTPLKTEPEESEMSESSHTHVNVIMPGVKTENTETLVIKFEPPDSE